MKSPFTIDALGLVALAENEIAKRGTTEHAEALCVLENAKKLWREQAIRKCPHCGKTLD